jgi:hypothetical protein
MAESHICTACGERTAVAVVWGCPCGSWQTRKEGAAIIDAERLDAQADAVPGLRAERDALKAEVERLTNKTTDLRADLHRIRGERDNAKKRAEKDVADELSRLRERDQGERGWMKEIPGCPLVDGYVYAEDDKPMCDEALRVVPVVVRRVE